MTDRHVPLIERYRARLPFAEGDPLVSLQEGSTPLLRAPVLSEMLGATVRLKLDVIKGKRVPWMRIEKPESIVSVHADRPLEDAVWTATFNLMDWLIRDYGFTPTDAYCLVSTCPDFRINVYQMCKIAKLCYVAGAELPKRYLVTT